MDVSKLCRGCMNEVASWEKENFDTKAVEMFCFCTNIRITEEDRLPKQFCYDCIIKIESAYTFITEAQKVNVTLKNIISRTNTVIVEPATNLKTFNQPISSTGILDNDMKLTLPDYIICSVIEKDMRQLPDLAHNLPPEAKVDSHDNPVDNNNSGLEVRTQTPVPLKAKKETPPHLPPEAKNHDSPVDNSEIKIKTETPETERSVETEQDTEKVEIKSNVCLICKKSFISKTWYEKHMQKEHSGKKYICPHCPKSFSRPSQLTAHSVTHSDERKFPCTICGKKFKQRKQLAVHTKGHAEARPFTCDKCSARFKTKSILKSHMAAHEKGKQFLCCFCGWSFNQAGNLKVHMRVHTGEKPFECGACAFRAAAASSLRRHQRTHAPAAAHVCARCGKHFNDKSNLARHVRTHTGELPYACPWCAGAFSDSWKRKTHLMRAHKLALHDIPRMRTDGRILQ